MIDQVLFIGCLFILLRIRLKITGGNKVVIKVQLCPLTPGGTV